jgi:hypothetical protein
MCWIHLLQSIMWIVSLSTGNNPMQYGSTAAIVTSELSSSATQGETTARASILSHGGRSMVTARHPWEAVAPWRIGHPWRIPTRNPVHLQ